MLNTFNSLTLAIITYRRPEKLKKCLELICQQTTIPQVVLIIDNDPKKSAKKITLSFCHILPVTWINEKKVGIPYARNRAMSHCTTKYLAFIDDDCQVDKNWVQSALNSISNNSFVVGQTIPINPNHPVAKTQYQNYHQWFLKNINPKNNSINPQILDTKNIIFNFQKIKNIKFDTKLRIFEDVDFGLQIKQSGLSGKYNPQMIIFHQEEENLFQAIKKNYTRGKFKRIINHKWGNFDNYSPITISSIRDIFRSISHPLNYFFSLAFSLGYQNNPQSQITIVNHLDRSANGHRAKNVASFLQKNNYCVELFDCQPEFDRVTHQSKYFFTYGKVYFLYRLLRLAIYKFRLNFDSELFYIQFLLRGKIIKKYLSTTKTTTLICQFPDDMACLLAPHDYQTIYDAPTIYSQEIELSNKYKPYIIDKIKKMEKRVFKESDYVSFHWYSFFDLAKKLKINIPHPLVLNWGCIPVNNHNISQFSQSPKIVYLGILNFEWANSPLLKKIQQSSQFPVDIYSYETPNDSDIKTKGYMKNLNDLSQYQFGLITITDDLLRNHGFSAKYLSYLEYGLPVLCPEWRRDKLLEPATIYYNEKNFNQQIKKYFQEKLWTKKHLAALKLSRQLNWQKNLQPLLSSLSTPQVIQ